MTGFKSTPAPYPVSFIGVAALRPDVADGGVWPDPVILVPAGRMPRVLDSLWAEADNMGWGVATQDAASSVRARRDGIPPPWVDRVVLVISDPRAFLRIWGPVPAGRPGGWASTAVLVEEGAGSAAVARAFERTGRWRMVRVAPDGFLGPWGRIPGPRRRLGPMVRAAAVAVRIATAVRQGVSGVAERRRGALA